MDGGGGGGRLTGCEGMGETGECDRHSWEHLISTEGGQNASQTRAASKRSAESKAERDRGIRTDRNGAASIGTVVVDVEVVVVAVIVVTVVKVGVKTTYCR